MSYLEKLEKLVDSETFEKIKSDIGDKTIILNDGSYIPRDVFNESKKKLEDQLKSVETERDQFKTNFEKLKKDADESKKKNQTVEEKVAELEKKLAEEAEDKKRVQTESVLKAKKSRVDAKLLEAGVKDPKFRKALLREIEDWETVKLSEVDELVDFDETVETFKKDFAPFFGEKVRSGNPANVGDPLNQKKYETMTDEQYIKAREEEGIS